MTHETTAPVQSLVDEVLAELDHAEKTHLDGEVRDMAREAMLLIRQQKEALDQQAAPDGWKMVPLKPTEEMLISGYGTVPPEVLLCPAWDAMIAAAPALPGQQPVAWVREDGSDVWTDAKKRRATEHAGTPGALVAQKYSLPLYSSPPAHQSQAELVLLNACEEALAWFESRTKGFSIDAKDTLRMAIAEVRSNTAPPAPEQAEQPECGCCGKTGPCDLDCDAVVSMPRELLEQVLKKWSTHGAFTDVLGWQGPFDELRALLGDRE